MAAFGTLYTIKRLSGGFCIENVGSSVAFDDADKLASHIKAVWGAEIDSVVSAMAVSTSLTFSVEVSIDGGGTYNFVLSGITTKKNTGAATAYTGFVEQGHATDLEHSNAMTDLFIGKLFDALDGISDGDSVSARLDNR